MRLAILGTGKIVHEALEALKAVQEIEIDCIYARAHSREKAETLAKDYGIPKVYTDYQELLRTSDTDFVYVGLVNSVHYEYAKQALLAGKHVIMEKPFTSTAAEAEEIADLAREKNCMVLEAVTCLNTPLFDRIKELLPQIGPVRMVQCNYSQYSSRYNNYLKNVVEPCFDPELSGGALYDINIYNLNLIAALFGMPETVQYYPNIGFNGIDISGTVMMTYPGFVASAAGAKDSDSACYFMIQGEKGWLRIPNPPSDPKSLESMINREFSVYAPELPAHRMTEEFRRFAKIADDNKKEQAEAALNTSVTVLKLAEYARKSAGIRFGVDG